MTSAVSLIVFGVLISIIEASPEERIIGGKEAGDGQFPFQASIQVDHQHNCGGLIIYEKWILSAAHCFEGLSTDVLSVLVGTNSLSSGGDRYQVKNVFVNGGWDGSEDDIALVQLTKPISYNSKIQPIPLATVAAEPGETVEISGWGYIAYPSGQTSDDLMYINSNTIDLDVCRKLMAPEFIPNTQICTLTKVDEGLCKGDSGGGVIHNGQAIGIVSWGKPCAQGKPDMHTSIPNYVNWVSQVINLNSE